MKMRLEIVPALLGFVFVLVFPAFGRMNAPLDDTDRKPAVAGSFYPADPAALRNMVSAFLENGQKGPLPGTVRALVVPHAGYVFSGSVAASGYNQVRADYPYARVFILASSHRLDLGKASVFTEPARSQSKTANGTSGFFLAVSSRAKPRAERLSVDMVFS